MALTLNHQQRLNIIGVLGAQDIRGREAHSVWHLQDVLDLDEEEKRLIEFRPDPVNGIHQWNTAKELPVRSFDLGEPDLERIRKAIEDFGQFKGSRDRIWLEPLLAQLHSPASHNGTAAG